MACGESMSGKWLRRWSAVQRLRAHAEYGARMQAKLLLYAGASPVLRVLLKHQAGELDLLSIAGSAQVLTKWATAGAQPHRE